MIKRLKIKFISLTMISVVVVLLIVATSLNIVNKFAIERMTNNILQVLLDNNGELPEINVEDNQYTDIFNFRITKKNKFESSYFLARTDKYGNIIHLNIQNTQELTYNEAKKYVNEVLSGGKQSRSGRIDNYKYLCNKDDGGYLYAFLDCGFQYQTLSVFLRFTVYISIVSLLFIFVFVYIISDKAISPVVNAVQKQKTFITDAGHELKTPLAIITANADVLELLYEKNEWTESIKKQSERLNELVKSMLTLAKLEDQNKSEDFVVFDVSSVIKKSAAPFGTLASSKNKTIATQIEDNINIKGSEGAIGQLVSIFLDNAVKYASKDSEIKISLTSKGKNAVLSVSNRCDNMPDAEDINKLFRRFFRADFSRSRDTGGFGIGLSIAKNIVTNHNGKIFAQCLNENTIEFTAIIPKAN